MEEILRRARRRLWRGRIGRRAWQGAFYAACAAALAALALKFYPLCLRPLPWLLAAVGVGAALAACAAALHPPSLDQAALELDLRAQLAERLSSARLLAAEADGNPAARAVLRDAEARAAGLDVASLFPFPWPREARWLAAPLAALLLVELALPVFDPWGRRAALREAEERQALLESQAEQLLLVKRRVVPRGRQPDKDAQEIAQEIDAAVKAFRAPNMTRAKAMARLSRLADMLERRRDQLARNAPPNLPRSLERRLTLARAFARAMAKGQLKAAARQLNLLADKLAKGEIKPKEAPRLKEELKALAKEIRKTNPKLAKALAEAAGKLSAKDIQQAAKTLAKAGASLKELKEMLQQLREMDAALAKVAKLQKQLGRKHRYTRCRICGRPLHCDNPLCDAAAGGECPLGDRCPFICGVCPECRALGLAIAALGELRDEGQGQGQGEGRGQGRPGRGGGMQGPGRGRGGHWGELPEEKVQMEATRIRGMRSNAKPLAVYFTRGAGRKTPSKVKAAAVARRFRAAAEEALAKERIPQSEKEFIRRYFNTIEIVRRTPAKGE